MQNPFKEFLYFSQGERRGILVLITGIILVFLSGYIYIYQREHHHYVTETTSNSRPDRHTKEEVSYVITCAIGSTIGVLHKWSRDNFNLAPEVIADILSEVFLSGMLPLLS